jgi:hypothetical protein
MESQGVYQRPDELQTVVPGWFFRFAKWICKFIALSLASKNWTGQKRRIWLLRQSYCILYRGVMSSGLFQVAGALCSRAES